jgi:zinc/manganese transport system substrate-binding protein
MRSLLPLSIVALGAVLTVTGCAAPAPADDGTLSVVASTNTYGSIATAIGGSHISVTSIISDPSQDPHSFEGSAQVQLALAKADIVIENGGGYDDWATTLLAGAGNPDATVLTVADISGYNQKPASGEFNEHLWYDFPTMQKLARSIVAALSKEDPADAASFTRAAAAFDASLTKLEAQEAALAKTATGTGVAITEPVPLYLLDASGFTNVTPSDFSEAVEEGSDVTPAVLQKTLGLFASGAARLLVYNAQTSGPETDQLVAAAKAAGTPIVPVTETMPAGNSYIGWMTANLAAITAAAS